MDKIQFLNALKSEKIEYVENEPMNRHTTFKIGGNADIFVNVTDTKQLKAALKAALESNVPSFILGRGSNLLVSDKGIEGAVISLNALDEISIKGDNVICGAGASLRSVCLSCLKQSLSGLEFAYGIPGSMGGAVFMNAGAYGGEMAQVVERVRAVDGAGNEVLLCGDELKFGYRTSAFKTNGLIITEVTLKLSKGDSNEIKAQMDDFFNRRREKQPLEFPSAGSTFKRPEGYFAGALIEKNNLKGVGIGGAQVSEKHAGFVINRGAAKCEDVLSLIKKIKQTVLQNDGVILEPEVIFVGRE